MTFFRQMQSFDLKELHPPHWDMMGLLRVELSLHVPGIPRMGLDVVMAGQPTSSRTLPAPPEIAVKPWDINKGNQWVFISP